jgi:hypothetical protein
LPIFSQWLWREWPARNGTSAATLATNRIPSNVVARFQLRSVRSALASLSSSCRASSIASALSCALSCFRFMSNGPGRIQALVANAKGGITLLIAWATLHVSTVDNFRRGMRIQGWFRRRWRAGWPTLSLLAPPQMRLPLDKSDGVVKDIVVLALRSSVGFAREVEDQDPGNLTLNQSPVEPFHQPSIRPRTATMILLCEHPALIPGCESAQSTPAV